MYGSLRGQVSIIIIIIIINSRECGYFLPIHSTAREKTAPNFVDQYAYPARTFLENRTDDQTWSDVINFDDVSK